MANYWLPQEGPQLLAATCPVDEIFYDGERGGGKGQPHDAEIVTPFGITTMGDLKVGARIAAPDGGEQTVTEIFDRGEQDVYRVEVTGGATIETDDDHIWSVLAGGERRLMPMRQLKSLFHARNLFVEARVSDEGRLRVLQIESIEYIGRKETRCIKVSNPNGLYLTNGFVVTHNSDTLLGRHVLGALRHESKWNGLIVRRKYKDLIGLRKRIDELIALGLPAKRVGGEEQLNFLRFDNGATVMLAAIHHPKMLDDFQGQAFTEVSIDEAPTLPFLAVALDKLKGTLRSVHGIKCTLFLTGNPGGAASSVIKALFIDPVPPWQVNKVKYKGVDGKNYEVTRVFIPSALADNRILQQNDPNYGKKLASIDDPLLKRAWSGDWSVTIGQAFHFTTQYHVVEPIWPVPEHAPIYMTFDYGYGAPFSVQWWWVDGDNRLYHFAEWYGWDNFPNRGLRLTDQQIAEGIIKREERLVQEGKIATRMGITRLAGPDCWNKKPDYLGGGQGPSTFEEFAKYGLILTPGDPKRELKIRQFRNRLLVPANYDKDNPKTWPMLVVYNTCRQFIRTIPSLVVDELTGEYLEEYQEDHAFDSAAHVCMARPTGVPDSILMEEARKRKQEEKLRQLDAPSRAATEELHYIEEQLKAGLDPSLDGMYGSAIPM